MDAGLYTFRFRFLNTNFQLLGALIFYAAILKQKLLTSEEKKQIKTKKRSTISEDVSRHVLNVFISYVKQFNLYIT